MAVSARWEVDPNIVGGSTLKRVVDGILRTPFVTRKQKFGPKAGMRSERREDIPTLCVLNNALRMFDLKVLC